MAEKESLYLGVCGGTTRSNAKRIKKFLEALAEEDRGKVVTGLDLFDTAIKALDAMYGKGFGIIMFRVQQNVFDSEQVLHSLFTNMPGDDDAARH